jgi:short-subunit dehydrogenase
VFGRSDEKVNELCSRFPSIKGSLVWDLRDEAPAARYQQYLAENGIRAIISTVGLGVGNPIPFLTQGELQGMIGANLMSPFMILKYSLLPLKQLKGGEIIMFGSITSFQPEQGACGYTATKMALRGLVESTRRELRMGFQSLSVHGVYTANVTKIGIASILDAVSFLLRLPYGVHADVIVG